ncbi:MAG: helix-turn-helix domain-containing protein [Mycobacteriales bacterium]
MDGRSFTDTLRQLRARYKLSQLELAARAGTTQRHVSFIESGRSIPGRGMVIRLAESLDLSLRDRNDLLLASGYAPAYPETSLQDPTLRPMLTALDHVLEGHLPYPAIVVNRFGTLVAANQAFNVFTDGVLRELLEPPVNVYRLALHPLGMAPRVRNLAGLVRHIQVGLRHELLRNRTPELASLLEELDQYVPSSGPETDPENVGFAVPLEFDSPLGTLRMIATIATFATAVDVTVAELKLEAFLPADAATASIFAKLHPRLSADKLSTPHV